MPRRQDLIRKWRSAYLEALANHEALVAHNRNPTDRRIADELGASVEDVRELMLMLRDAALRRLERMIRGDPARQQAYDGLLRLIESDKPISRE